MDEACPHNEAHHDVDLDQPDETKKYRFVCPQCGREGPYASLERAKGAFYGGTPQIPPQALRRQNTSAREVVDLLGHPC